MLTPQNLLRVVIELIFVLLGGLIVWLRASHHIFFVPNGLPWLMLSIAMILWGVRALYKPGKWWSRWEDWTRGLSLILLGIVMLAILRVSFLWVGRLFALAGLLLILRGLIGSFLVLRPR